MKSTRFTPLRTAASTLAAILIISSAVAVSPPVHSVRGHAIWPVFSTVTMGLPNGGNSFNQLIINAWQDQDGSAHGVIEWTYDTNPLPGGGGQGASGYPWTINVNTLVMLDVNAAYVQGVVVNSGQVPTDVGTRWGFTIVDNGNRPNDSPDVLVDYSLGIYPIHIGDFTVR